MSVVIKPRTNYAQNQNRLAFGVKPPNFTPEQTEAAIRTCMKLEEYKDCSKLLRDTYLICGLSFAVGIALAALGVATAPKHQSRQTAEVAKSAEHMPQIKNKVQNFAERAIKATK